MAREFFCAYHSYLQSMRKLTDEECGRLFRALLTYSITGEETELEGREDIVFDIFSQQIDRDKESYEKTCQQNRKNRASVSGSQQPSTTDDDRQRPSTTDDETTQEEEKEKEEYKEEYKDKGKDEEEGGEAPPAPPKRTRFSPPTVDEVDKYCQERGNGVNAQHFVDFYAAKGWKVGSQPMKDWRAAVRTWEQRDDRTRQALYPPRPTPKVVTQAQYTQRPHKDGQAMPDANTAKAYGFDDELKAFMAGLGG